MCSGSEAGSYLRLIDCVCHSTLGVRVKKKNPADREKVTILGVWYKSVSFGAKNQKTISGLTKIVPSNPATPNQTGAELDSALKPCTHSERYRGTSLIRKRTLLGPYRRPMPRVLWGSGLRP